MTDEEWQNIDQLLASWWGQPWDSRKGEGYRLALDRFAPGQVARALEAAGRKDPKWRPGALELVALIEGDGSAHPDPDTAWDLIVQAVKRVGCSMYDPRFAQRHQAAVDWLAGQDRVLAAFAARRGLCGPGSLGVAPVDPAGGDPDQARIALAMIKRDYREVLDRAGEREALGKPAVAERELTVRATGETGEGFADVLRRFGGNAGELEAGDA